MKALSKRYECAVMFCRNKRRMPVAIQLTTKTENYQAKTHWVCVEHAIAHLESVQREIEQSKSEVSP